MKTNKLFIFLMIILGSLSMESCGPIVISSTPDTPPPPWFYPNRIETVRYVYFPDYNIYYDISFRHYIYFENDVWITVDVLPTQYHYINLNRSRYIRIRNYHGDNIRSYHSTNRYYNRSRSTRNRYDRSRSSTNRSRSTTTRSRSNRSNTSARSRTTKSRDSI